MPYVDEDDPKLPKDILEMPADERRTFVNTFNGVIEKCEADDGKDCEGRAMAMAQSAVEMMSKSAKVGRRISAATRAMLQKAIDALLSLMAEGEATDADRQAAQEALEELFEGEDAGPMTDMMAQPEMMMKMIKAELERRQDGMIAFFLPKGVADELALPNDEAVGYKAEPAGQLHITLCYFPDINQLGHEVNTELLVAELTKFAKEMGPVMGRLSGVGRFNNADSDAFYVSFDGANLPGLRQHLVDCLSKAGVWNMNGEHGFSPHITLAYVPAGAPDPVTIDWVTAVHNRELTFSALSLVLGNGRTDFELTGWNYKADREKLQSDAEILFDLEAPCGRKAIKVINRNARRIASYATVWGEQDCDAERMTQEAIAPYIGKGVPYMFWMHGLDKEFGSNVVGVWDAKSFKIDDIGLYVEGNISRDQWGNKAWGQIESAGSFGLSVGSQWFLVKRKQLGDGTVAITDWPLLDISVMKGGRQCVPSAQRKLDAEIEPFYRKAAAKLNVDWPPIDHLDGRREPEAFIKIGDTNMDENEFNAAVTAKVAEALAAKDAAEAKKADEQKAIETKVAELAAVKAAELNRLYDEKVAELEKVNATKANDPAKSTKKQPLAPSTGMPVGNTGGAIKVFSPMDRLSTLDLSVRYDILKSWGKQPSERMFRALAERAVKMSQEEDTLYIKNGQPVKAPALDWENLAPRNLNLDEVDGKLQASKVGRYGSGMPDASGDPVTPNGIRQLAELAVKANELVYSTQSGFGDEWVPTLTAAQLWRTVRLEAAVLSQFTQIDMPSQPYDYPIEGADPTFYKVSETTDESQLVLTGGPFTDSKPGTGKVTFSAGKLGALVYFSEEMEEDSIIASEAQFQDQFGVKMAHVIDEVLISGDESTGSANISFDGSAIAATSRFLIAHGLRYQALNQAGNFVSGGTLSIEDFGKSRQVLGTAGKWGVNPEDLIFLLDPGVYHKSILLPEVLTLDKFGAMATVYKGQLGSLMGVPLLVSEDYGLTDTAGKISATGGNNTLGSFLAVNKRAVMVGWRRRPRIRVVGLPGAEARFIVGTARFDLQFREADNVGLIYGLTI